MIENQRGRNLFSIHSGFGKNKFHYLMDVSQPIKSWKQINTSLEIEREMTKHGSRKYPYPQ